MLVIFFLLILLKNYGYCQSATPSLAAPGKSNPPANFSADAPLKADTSTLLILPEQNQNKTEPALNDTLNSPSALKAGQLQNIRKIYQFEHEIYNEIRQNQKNLNLT
jgi:hypothetical protein